MIKRKIFFLTTNPRYRKIRQPLFRSFKALQVLMSLKSYPASMIYQIYIQLKGSKVIGAKHNVSNFETLLKGHLCQSMSFFKKKPRSAIAISGEDV